MGVKPRHQPEQHRLDDGSTREHARGEDACGNQQEYQNPEHRHAFASFTIRRRHQRLRHQLSISTLAQPRSATCKARFFVQAAWPENANDQPGSMGFDLSVAATESTSVLRWLWTSCRSTRAYARRN